MTWTIEIGKKVGRNLLKLPQQVRDAVFALIRDIEARGPVRGNWHNYGKLSGGVHHCHIKKGHPTYVAVWVETDKDIKLVEVTYVGTHEKAPY